MKRKFFVFVLLLIFLFRFSPFVELCPRRCRNNPENRIEKFLIFDKFQIFGFCFYVSHTGRFDTVKLWSITFVWSQKNVTTKGTNKAVQCIGVHIHRKTIGQILWEEKNEVRNEKKRSFFNWLSPESIHHNRICIVLLHHERLLTIVEHRLKVRQRPKTKTEPFDDEIFVDFYHSDVFVDVINSFVWTWFIKTWRNDFLDSKCNTVFAS